MSRRAPSALAYVRACVRTAGDAGPVAWRIPAASAAGIVRSGPGAGRDVREQGVGRPTWSVRQNWTCHRRRGRGSSGSPAPLRGWEANARPRPAGLPGPAGRCRAAGPGRARAGPDRGLERPPSPPARALSSGIARLESTRSSAPRDAAAPPSSPKTASPTTPPPTTSPAALRPLQRTARIHRRRRPHHHHPRRPHPREVGSTSLVLSDGHSPAAPSQLIY